MNNKVIQTILILYTLVCTFRLIIAQNCPFNSQPLPFYQGYQDQSATNGLINMNIIGSIPLNQLFSPSSNDQYIYIFDQQGNKVIHNISTQQLFSTAYLVHLNQIVNWDIDPLNSLEAILLDSKGVIYPIDVVNGKYKKWFRYNQPLSSKSCASIRYRTIVTWNLSNVNFYKYESSKQIVQTVLDNQNKQQPIQMCLVRDDKDSIFIVTKTGIIQEFSLKNLDVLNKIFLAYSVDKVINVLQNANFLVIQITETPSSLENRIVIYKDYKELYSFTIQSPALSIKIDTQSSLLIIYQQQNIGQVFSLSQKKLLKTIEFTELQLDFKDSTNQVQYLLSDGLKQKEYLQSLVKWKIYIFQEKDIFLFVGDSFVFFFKLSTLAPLSYKALDIASTQILQVYLVEDNLAIVGDKQLSYFSISKLSLIQVNYVFPAQQIYNGKMNQLSISSSKDKIIISQKDGRITFWKYSDLQLQQVIINSTSNQLQFIEDPTHKKLIVYSLDQKSNDQITYTPVFKRVIVFDYLTGKQLFSQSLENVPKVAAFELNQGHTFIALDNQTIKQLNFDQPNQFTDIFTYTTTSEIYNLDLFSSYFIVYTQTQVIIFSYLSNTPVNVFNVLLNQGFYRLIIPSLNKIAIQNSDQAIMLLEYSSSFSSITTANSLKGNVQDSITYFDATNSWLIVASNINGIIGGKVTLIDLKNLNVITQFQIEENILRLFLYQVTNSDQIIIVSQIGGIMLRKINTSLTLNKTSYPLLDIPKYIYFDNIAQELLLFFTKGQFIRYSVLSTTEGIIYRSDFNFMISNYYIDSVNKYVTVFFENQMIRFSLVQKSVFRKQSLGKPIVDFFVDYDRNLIIVIEGKAINYMEASTGVILKSITTTATLSKIKLNKKLNLLAIISTASNALLYQYSSLTLLKDFVPASTDACTSLAGVEFDENLFRLFIYCKQGSFNVWDLKTYKTIKSFPNILSTNTINTISLYSEKNLILILGNNSWGKMLAYDTLAVVIDSIPGGRGQFFKDQNTFCTVSPDGYVRFFYTSTKSIFFDQQIHSGTVGYIFFRNVPGQLYPDFVTVGADLNLAYVSNLDINTKKIVKLDYRPNIFTYDEPLQLIFQCDTLGNIVVFNFSSLTVKRIIKFPTKIIQLLPVSQTNILFAGQDDGTINSIDNISFLFPELTHVPKAIYGINQVVSTNNKQYILQQSGVLQQWDISTNQLIYGLTIPSISQNYPNMQLIDLSQANSLLVLHPIYMAKISYDFSKQVSQVIDCQKSMNIKSKQQIICIQQGNVSIYDYNLQQQASITINDISQSYISFAEFAPNNNQFLLITSVGSIFVLNYDDSIHQITLMSSTPLQTQPFNYYFDTSNNMLITTSSDGKIYYQTLGATSFTAAQELVTYSKSDSSQNQINIYQYKSYLFIRKIMNPEIEIYLYPSLKRATYSDIHAIALAEDLNNYFYLYNPCVELDSNLFIDESLDIIILSCRGQHNAYSLSNFQYIGSSRIFNEYQQLTLSSLSLFKNSQFRTVTSNSYINFHANTLFELQINRPTTVGAETSLQLNGYIPNIYSISKIISYTVLSYSSEGNQIVYGFEIVGYSNSIIQNLNISLKQKLKSCSLETDANSSNNKLQALDQALTQMSTFTSLLQQIFLTVKITQGQYLPKFPQIQMRAIIYVTIQPSDSSVETIVQGNLSFFERVSSYKSLKMQDLVLEFKPLDSVSIISIGGQLSQIELINISIQSSIPNMVISFTQISTITIQTMKILSLLQTKLDSTNYDSFLQFYQFSDLSISNLSISSQTLYMPLLKASNFKLFQQSDTTLLATISFMNIQISDIFFKQQSLSTDSQLINFQRPVLVADMPIMEIQFVNKVIIDKLIVQRVTIENILNKVTLLLLNFIYDISIKNSEMNSSTDLIYLVNQPDYIVNEEQDMNKEYNLNSQNLALSKLIFTNNTVSYMSQSLFIIKSKTINIEGLKFERNKLTPFSFYTLASLMYFENSQSITFTTLDLISNQKYQQGLIYLNQVNLATLTIITAIENKAQVNGGIIYSIGSNIKLSKSNFNQNSASQGGVFYLIDSNIQIEGSDFHNSISENNGGCIYGKNTTITINKSNFYDSQAGQSGGSIYSENQVLNIFATLFYSSSSVSGGGAIAVTGSNLSIDKCDFQQCNSQGKGGAIKSSSQDSLQISKSFFSSSKSADGGAVYFTSTKYTNSNNYIISDTEFKSNVAYGSGGALLIETGNLDITNSQFIKNTAAFGGAIRFYKQFPNFLGKVDFEIYKTLAQNKVSDFNGLSFDGNKAYVIGDNIASLMTQVKFKVDFPELTFIESKPFTPFVKDTQKRELQQQQVELHYMFKNFRSGLTNFTFRLSLQDSFGQYINTNYKQEIQADKFQITSKKLEQELSSLLCRVSDNEKSTSIELQKLAIYGQKILDYTMLDDKEQPKQKAEFEIDNIQISGVPGDSSSSFCIQVEGLNVINPDRTYSSSSCINFGVQFRKCKEGEIYSSKCSNCLIKQCFICTNGTYSFENPESAVSPLTSCNQCNYKFSRSCEANQIVLKPGYWRESNTTDQIYECDSLLDSCNGLEESKYCKVGYVGPLCETCDQYGDLWGSRYGKVHFFQNSSCQPCSQNQGYMIWKGFVIFLSLILIYYQIHLNNHANQQYVYALILRQSGMLYLHQSLYEVSYISVFKIFLHYHAMQRIAIQIPIQYISTHEEFYYFIRYYTVPFRDMLNDFDCLLSLNRESTYTPALEYLRFIFTSSLCLVGLVFSALVYFVVTFQHYKKLPSKSKTPLSQKLYETLINLKNMLGSSMIFIFIYYQQIITESALSLIDCPQIGGKRYISSQRNKECYTTKYYLWFILFGGMYILFSIVLPVIIFFYMKKNQNNLHNQFFYKIKNSFGILFLDFKRNRWWWELYKMLLRQITILFCNLSDFNALQKVSIVLIVLFFYEYTSTKAQPYTNMFLRGLDKSFNSITIIMVILSVFQTTITNTTLISIISIIILILKFFQIGQILSYYLQTLILAGIKKFYCLSKYFNFKYLKHIGEERQGIWSAITSKIFAMFKYYYRHADSKIHHKWKKLAENLKAVVIKTREQEQKKLFALSRIQQHISVQLNDQMISEKISQNLEEKQIAKADTNYKFLSKFSIYQHDKEKEVDKKQMTQINDEKEYSDKYSDESSQVDDNYLKQFDFESLKKNLQLTQIDCDSNSNGQEIEKSQIGYKIKDSEELIDDSMEIRSDQKREKKECHSMKQLDRQMMFQGIEQLKSARKI